jgi:Peptidase A4 family
MKPAEIPFPGMVGSTNWAGYAVPGAAFTYARGSWIVPSATCYFDPDSYASFWVGIDGYHSSTVEQIGTDSDCDGANPTYYAWYEFYPNPQHVIAAITVSPGDTMSASVTFSGTKCTLKITDHTVGKTVSVTKSNMKVRQSSAEWIVEAPNVLGLVLPLADFIDALFGEGYTSVNSTNWATDYYYNGFISAFPTRARIVMVTDSNVVKAWPSGLSHEGSTFDVEWEHE